MLRKFLGVSLLSIALAAPASAQANLVVNRTLPQGGVSYTTFTVTSAGVFDIFTTSATGAGGTTPFDPMIYLFAGSTASGSALAFDDDACSGGFAAQCGPAIAAYNSLINDFTLGVGTYTVAVGGFFLSEASAVSGTNLGNSYQGDYQLHIASNAELNGNGPFGSARIEGADTTVPEPSTYALMAGGLAGVAGVARRRRAA